MTDNDYGRGDDRFMRGAPDKKQPPSKGGCLIMSLLISLPASLVIGTVVLVKPLFRR